MDRYEQIKAGFDKYASAYQERFMDLTLYDDTYLSFCDFITSKKAELLEIGCGPGNITRFLLRHRPDFQITATDVSPAMVEQAQANNPTADCQVLDARNIGSIPRQFDGTICGFCLPYLSPEDTSQLITDCSALLRPGGIVYFSTIEADERHQSGYETTSNGQDQFFIWYHHQDELVMMMEQHNLAIISRFRIPYAPTNLGLAFHFIVIARKLADPVESSIPGASV